jgi:hypothetical protein
MVLPMTTSMQYLCSIYGTTYDNIYAVSMVLPMTTSMQYLWYYL